jgi:hypothetical protein
MQFTISNGKSKNIEVGSFIIMEDWAIPPEFIGLEMEVLEIKDEGMGPMPYVHFADDQTSAIEPKLIRGVLA